MSSGLRRHRAVVVSVAAHLAVLAVLVFHNPRVIDLSPDWLAYGDAAHTYKLTYFPPAARIDATPRDAAKLLFPVRASKVRPHSQPPEPAPEPQQVIVIADAEAAGHNSRAGSPLGTMIDGPIAGHEVHIAYPVVYPDPPVARAELPRDLQGDVVIEVTIDSQGNVVETQNCAGDRSRDRRKDRGHPSPMALPAGHARRRASRFQARRSLPFSVVKDRVKRSGHRIIGPSRHLNIPAFRWPDHPMAR